MSKTNIIQQDDDPRIISYNTLRKAVGWLGLSIPFAMVIGNYIFNHCVYIQPTISDYYYTITGNLFVAILCADAMFLIAYKGYDKTDNRATNLAGVFAVIIALLPTNPELVDVCLIFKFPMNNLRNAVHLISAAAFFITLAFISFFLILKTA